MRDSGRTDKKIKIELRYLLFLNDCSSLFGVGDRQISYWLSWCCHHAKISSGDEWQLKIKESSTLVSDIDIGVSVYTTSSICAIHCS